MYTNINSSREFSQINRKRSSGHINCEEIKYFIEMMGCTELRVLGDFVNLLKSDHVIQSLI